ncbi:MAG: PASTA domain-containing protein [Ruminococcaceae bacterium]|nr:PASTA domain-containing protein [Oscillospiraceae bacterium]
MKKTKGNCKKNGIKGLIIAAVCCLLVAFSAGVFVLWSFFGPKPQDTVTLTVPNVVGKAADQIKAPRGFSLQIQYEYSDNVDRGLVICQKPLPGSKRKTLINEGVELTVTVSLGKKTSKIPDVLGMPYVSAAIKLRQMGADVVMIPIFDGAGDIGTVISCVPPANTKIEQGQRVVIYVAKARVQASVCVPDFVGMQKEQACFELLSRGLSLGQVIYDAESDAPAGTVIGQSPASDMYVRGGTHIDITVSGEAPGDDESTETESGQQSKDDESPKSPWWHFW